MRKQEDDTFRIVDGEHRFRASGHKRIVARDKGMLPVVILDVSDDRAVASTIRHNRARGTHSVQKTAEIIQQLTEEGWDHTRIIRELGMSKDEIERLKVADNLPGILAGRDRYMSPSDRSRFDHVNTIVQENTDCVSRETVILNPTVST